LEALTRSGWICGLEAVSTPKGGRPARRWQVNPLLFSAAETAETAQTHPRHEVSAVSAVSARQSVFDMDPDRGGEGLDQADDGLSIPAFLLRKPADLNGTGHRCDHCGALGATSPYDWPGRPDGIWLHSRCEGPWFDGEGRQ